MKLKSMKYKSIVMMLFLIGTMLSAAPGVKEITFQYIRNSDNSYPGDMSMESGYYEYEFWTGDGMAESARGTIPSSTSIGGMGGVVVTFNILGSPVDWDPYGMPSHPYVYLKVTNPYLGESSTFSGVLTIDYTPQTFTDDYALPVELISFTVRAENETVILTWETASEVDNAGFNIYRSLEYSGGFEIINNPLIPGAGNTSSGRVYTYEDAGVQSGNTYYYTLENVDTGGKTAMTGPVAVAVGASLSDLPDDYALIQNYPNPFNPMTTIAYKLPEVSEVRLSVYNIQGRLIELLVNDTRDAGYHAVQWNGVRRDGGNYPSGVYFYELRTDSYRDIKKMFFLK